MKMTNIKDFVAYKLKDVSDDALSFAGLTWVPVLFPYYPNRDLYFITLHVSANTGCFSHEERETLRDMPRSEGFVINSVFDACGYDPLFLIAESKHIDDVENVISKHTNPRYMSITTPANIIKRFGINNEDFQNIENEDIGLLKPLEEGIERIIKKGRFTKEDVRREFHDIDKWDNFVRFVPMNMHKVITMVFIQPPNSETERDVIDKIEKDYRVIDAYKICGDRRLLIKIITEDTNEVFEYIESFIGRKVHTISKIVLCTFKENGFPFETRQTPKLKVQLSPTKKDILRYVWEQPESLAVDRATQIEQFRDKYPNYIDTGLSDLKTEFESVEKEFVYKYSIKLNQDGWFKTLLFIKSALGGKKIVWDSIRNNLMDVALNYFSRMHCLVTGDFDFIIPIDCYRLQTLKRKISNFLEAEAETGKDDEKVKKYVTDIRAYFEESSGVKRELVSYEIAAIKAMIPNSRIATKDSAIPRNLYYNYYCRDQKPSKIGLNGVMKLAKAVLTTELHTEKLVHAFVRFKIMDMDGFNKELERLRKDREHIFLYREYDPVHNPGSKMLLLTTENFDSLLYFISPLDQYSRDTVTSLIFTKEFLRPDIPDRFRCKPCRVPVDEKCDACPQYIELRKHTDIRDVDLKITRIKPCTIAMVQLRIDNMDPLLPWYDKKDRKMIMTEVREKVIQKLDEAIVQKADIVVFPELSVPEPFVEEIKEKMKGHKIIVIAGTHLRHYIDDISLDGEEEKKKYYNVAPVLISDSKSEEVKQYDVHKNNKAHAGEIDIEAKNKNIRIQTGIGMLRFINTGYGNFSILICYDFLDNDMLHALLKVEIDLLIVPSWNRDPSRFEENARFAKGNRSFILLANNGLYGESQLYAPYKGKELKELKSKVLGEKIEDIQYYTINVLDLDRARDRDIWTRMRKRGKLSDAEEKLVEMFEAPSASTIKPIHSHLWVNGV